LQLYRQGTTAALSVAWLPKKITDQISRLNPDIINLQWINAGFIPLSVLPKLKKPLVMTLHDCWAFTGGCHYPFDCTRYQNNCGSCPQLESKHERDLTRWVWNRKADRWQTCNLTVTTPSRWLAQLAKSSSLFRNVRVEVIPNCLDLTTYKPIERNIARDLLGLPTDKLLVLFVALSSGSTRKGFSYLKQALRYLQDSGLRKDIQLMIVGSSQKSELEEITFECRPLGRLHDDISLALAYAAADVFVAPSIQDNLPNTVLEASACGTPAVAFDIGGMPDLIDHGNTGYLAQPFDPQDLAGGIEWVLSDTARHRQLRLAARAKVEREFDMSIVAQKYLALFQELSK
jgi:glycosyltransferase involved in cell wall biosynthesis